MSVSELAEKVMKELIPYRYYYNIPSTSNIPVNRDSNEKYLRFVIKTYISENNKGFIKALISLKEPEFIKELNIHYNFYKKSAFDLSNWLSHTEKLIGKNINDRYLINAFDDWLKEKSESFQEKKNVTPKYNTNYFNENSFQLFNYLNEKYEKEGSIKHINIYYFLKQLAKDQNDKYRFTIKIEKEYKPLIKEKFGIKITKFEKATYAYSESELPKLKDLEKKFKSSTK